MSGFTPAPLGSLLGQSAVAVPHTGDTTETTLATITIPANAMGANGQVVIEAAFSTTNSANNKTLKVKFGTDVLSQVATTSATNNLRLRVANRNSASSQVAFQGVNGYGSSGSSILTSSIDTTAAVTITITGQLALSSETVTLESYQVIVYPHG